MPMPEGFVPTTGFPPGYQPEAHGRPVVRVGTAGDPLIRRAAWTSYEQPKLAAEAVGNLETDRMLWGDCYLDVETGERVSPDQVIVRREKGAVRAVGRL